MLVGEHSDTWVAGSICIELNCDEQANMYDLLIHKMKGAMLTSPLVGEHNDTWVAPGARLMAS